MELSLRSGESIFHIDVMLVKWRRSATELAEKEGISDVY